MAPDDLYIDRNVIINNIVTRTSVRAYDHSRTIDTATVETILRAAMSAPTAVNRRPWVFIVVTDAQSLSKLGAALPYAKMTAQAPMAIVVCGDSARFLHGEDSTLWVQDLSAASENLLLAAHAYGLGAVWTALYPHHDRQQAVASLLSLPDAIIPFNVIPIGYPLMPHAPLDKWDPSRIHYNHW